MSANIGFWGAAFQSWSGVQQNGPLFPGLLELPPAVLGGFGTGHDSGRWPLQRRAHNSTGVRIGFPSWESAAGGAALALIHRRLIGALPQLPNRRQLT